MECDPLLHLPHDDKALASSLQAMIKDLHSDITTLERRVINIRALHARIKNEAWFVQPPLSIHLPTTTQTTKHATRKKGPHPTTPNASTKSAKDWKKEPNG
jgi:hypothetical protein